MKTMTSQEVFDQSVDGIIAQGGPSKGTDGVSCMYRGDNERSCGVGILITDEEYKPEMDDPDIGTSVSAIFGRGLLPKRLEGNLALLTALQQCHDNMGGDSDWTQYLCQVKEVAERYNLIWTPRVIKGTVL